MSLWIYKAILGKKKVEIIEFLAKNCDKNGFIFITTNELSKAINVSKPTIKSTFNLLNSVKILTKIKNGLYKINLPD